MDYKKITSRITGISVPLFGISWNPVDEEKRAARDLLHFLEDRRVLYYPDEREGADYCRQSVEEIRKELTRSLKSFTGTNGADVVKQIQKFRRSGKAVTPEESGDFETQEGCRTYHRPVEHRVRGGCGRRACVDHPLPSSVNRRAGRRR